MRKIYVYAGYYELFITGKPLSKPYALWGEFGTIEEAQDFCIDYDDHFYIERDLFGESYFANMLSYEEREKMTFDITEDGHVLQATNEWKMKQAS